MLGYESLNNELYLGFDLTRTLSVFLDIKYSTQGIIAIVSPKEFELSCINNVFIIFLLLIVEKLVMV